MMNEERENGQILDLVDEAVRVMLEVKAGNRILIDELKKQRQLNESLTRANKDYAQRIVEMMKEKHE